MDNMRTIMDFEFDTSEVQNTHFHQNLEIVYVLEGSVEVQIEPETYNLKKGDFYLLMRTSVILGGRRKKKSFLHHFKSILQCWQNIWEQISCYSGVILQLIRTSRMSS